ncbi:FAD-dependent monooxygenase [Trebonia sp.]|uniref:FAD-dependent monooxygenase n=1 Tax=Trebonia sp. TaxID=2767075 RepID=UPI0026364EB8|nr:FAD-dependent monooxygenase [Trebonia sp.]
MPELRVAVVGGGLSGLCAGLAFARVGWPVTIIERATGEPPGGAGLGLDRCLLASVTGVDTARVPVVSGNRPSAAWGLVRQFLLDAALAATGIKFVESVTVTGVRDNDPGGPVTLDSTAGTFAADVVVGADGVYSVTRRFVAPDQPAASYAGYMLWRGLVAESDVPGGLGGRGRDLEMHAAPGAHLVVYCVPGPDGRTDAGRRRVSYAWYDAGRTRLLREAGCIEDGTVVATLRGDQFPAGLPAQLAALARRWWPAPWGECIAWGVTHDAVFGTPVAEYLPERLVRGRVALVGDAAHVATPMTGAGFENALLDVRALAASLIRVTGADVWAGLDRYEQERLPHARRLVSSGMAWSRSYLRSA